MADQVVKVGITADASQLNAQFSSAAATTQTGSQKMAQAMAVSKQAAAALGEAYKSMGVQAAAGNQQAIDSLVEHMEAAEAARAAVAELKASQESLSEAFTGGESSIRTMNAELRSLQGSIFGDSRAASEFLTTLPGVGAAMEAAFPIFGVVALAGVFVDAGQKAYELYDKYLSLEGAAERFNKTVDAMRGKEFLDVHSIEEARAGIEASNESAKQLEGTVAELDKSTLWTRLKDLTVMGMLSNMTNQREEVISQDQANAHKLQAIALTEKQAEMQHQVNDAEIEAAHSGDAALFGQQKINAELQKHMALAAEEQRFAAERSGDPTAGRTMEQLTERTDSGEAGAESQNLANQKRLKAMEQEFNQEKAFHQLTIGEEAGYWRDRITEFQAGSSEYEQVLDRMDAAYLAESTHTAELLKEGEAKIKAAKAKATQQGVTDENQLDSMSKTAAEWSTKTSNAVLEVGGAWDRYHEELTKSQEITTANGAALERAQLSAEKASFSITELGAAKRKAAIDAETYTARLAELNRELEQLQANAKVDPLTGKTDAASSARIQGVQNQISQTKGQAAVSGVQDQTAQAGAMAKPYLTAFDQINNGFLQVQSKMILGTQSIQRDFANMGAQLVASTAAAFEKMLARTVQHEIATVAAHQAANAAKTTSDATAQAQATAISATGAIQQVAHEAAVAAAGAWAALSPIPIVGPALGAVAAAGTYAGVMALAAFDVGGIIPGMPGQAVPIVGHGGERVLTAGQTKTFESMVDNRNSGHNTDNLTVNNHTQFHGMTDGNFRQMLSRHSDAVGASVVKAHRNTGHRSMGR